MADPTPLQEYQRLMRASEEDPSLRGQAHLYYTMHRASIEREQRETTGVTLEHQPGKYRELAASGKSDLAAVYRARWPHRVEREEREAEHAAAIEQAGIAALIKPHLPLTPNLDKFERLQAESPTLASLNYQRNARRIDAEREARDAKQSELEAQIAQLRGQNPEQPSTLEQLGADLNKHAFNQMAPEERVSVGSFTMPGNLPEQPKTITHRGQTIKVIDLPQTPRPDGTPPDQPPSNPPQAA